MMVLQRSNNTLEPEGLNARLIDLEENKVGQKAIQARARIWKFCVSFQWILATSQSCKKCSHLSFSKRKACFI